MKKNKKTTNIRFRVSDKKKLEIKKFCKKNKMTMSELISYAVDYYMIEFYKGEADEDNE